MVRIAPLEMPLRSAEGSLPEVAGGVRYVARQPIMDLHARVHGYELLFRNGTDPFFSGDGNLATRTMLDNTVLFGLEKLTGGLPGFVNCTNESLIERMVDVLPASMTVLEILETLEPTPSLIEACRKLKASGFRLALDDFIWKPQFEPLVRLADYIKVDFTQADAAMRQELRRQLRGVTVALVAEKVETQEDYKQAREEGFAFFQGYYFCRPVLLKNRKVPSNKLSHIGILELLKGDAIDFRKLSRLLKRDTSLTYRLLRLVNSPMYAVRQEVRSIESALFVVGEDTFRRIALLAITSELNADQPVEILRMAFVRGRFCELAAGIRALDPTEQYLLGMLSLLPAMLRMPMETLTPSLPLRDEIRQALEGEFNAERILLQWLERHENGDWEACDGIVDAYGLDQERLLMCFAEAVAWAEDALRSVA
ncbi:MAG: HDOD domain-containing protein [Terracidiphilus sp.]|jgi:EAL and modified HD-GYP domain-containing signal transduction protein